MSTKSLYKVQRELETVAKRLWLESKSKEEFRERLDEYMNNVLKDEFMANYQRAVGRRVVKQGCALAELTLSISALNHSVLFASEIPHLSLALARNQPRTLS